MHVVDRRQQPALVHRAQRQRFVHRHFKRLRRQLRRSERCWGRACAPFIVRPVERQFVEVHSMERGLPRLLRDRDGVSGPPALLREFFGLLCPVRALPGRQRHPLDTGEAETDHRRLELALRRLHGQRGGVELGAQLGSDQVADRFVVGRVQDRRRGVHRPGALVAGVERVRREELGVQKQVERLNGEQLRLVPGQRETRANHGGVADELCTAARSGVRVCRARLGVSCRDVDPGTSRDEERAAPARGVALQIRQPVFGERINRRPDGVVTAKAVAESGGDVGSGVRREHEGDGWRVVDVVVASIHSADVHLLLVRARVAVTVFHLVLIVAGSVFNVLGGGARGVRCACVGVVVQAAAPQVPDRELLVHLAFRD
mmetsp:Transcript_38243/g.118184  ORF Transcript_38243/g.118184 Transcript_38243/m.118184 type:complete len:374 (+) Transcript_38243:518-1639(+)